MKCGWIALCAALLAVAILCGCAGYFHYHPIKTTEQATMEPGARMSPGEPLGAPATRGISAAPVSEEALIK